MFEDLMTKSYNKKRKRDCASNVMISGRELILLLTQDKGSDREKEIRERSPLDTPKEESTSTEVSLNLVVGLTNPKMMKMIGRIEGQKVIVMIYPGAMHNFISIATLEKTNLLVTSSKSFGVSLDNGESFHGVWECKGVKV